jgi:alpha-tubulin suppressor-like RCC1 family protein
MRPCRLWQIALLAGVSSACGARSTLRDAPGADVTTESAGSDGAGAGSASLGAGAGTSMGASMSTGAGAGMSTGASMGTGAGGTECDEEPCLPDPSSIHLTVGSQHSCVTAVSGGIKCWGHNDGGQLGNNSSKESGVPVAVVGLSSGMLSLAASGGTCAATVGGALLCWGHNDSGQLGNGSTAVSLTPVGVKGLSSGVTAVAAGGLHTCAVAAGGAVKCWGDNSSGELGNGTTASSPVPVGVKGLSSGGVALALGFGHTCALTKDGAVKCWGLDKYGELGNGTTGEAPFKTPVDVNGLSSGVTAIASSSLHTCALTAGGGVKCWGHNLDGEIGDGTTQDSSVPVDVEGLSSGVTAIGVGSSHTCAVTEAGGVKCWGNNSFGQLGDDSTTVRHEPVDEVNLSSGAVAVALGFDHTCAVLITGAVKCWGGNFYSQLGDGTTTQSLVPVDVKGL